MSQSTKAPERAGDSLPAWISAGIVGLALGGGGTYLVMQNYGLGNSKASAPVPAMTPPAGSSAMGGMGGGMGGMGGGMGGMGGGMGGMMGGMGGGGGGGGVKRNLTSLVGKLELLSRPDLKLNVDLAADQQAKIAAKLDQLAKVDKMTADEAEEHLADLEGLLTEEQKTTLGSVGLPPPARGGGAGGPPGGAPPAGGAPPVMGGGAPPDENPFTQEVNERRLKDLLGRLSVAPAEKEATPEEKEKSADTAGAETDK